MTDTTIILLSHARLRFENRIKRRLRNRNPNDSIYTSHNNGTSIACSPLPPNLTNLTESTAIVDRRRQRGAPCRGRLSHLHLLFSYLVTPGRVLPSRHACDGDLAGSGGWAHTRSRKPRASKYKRVLVRIFLRSRSFARPDSYFRLSVRWPLALNLFCLRL